jgi:hypothetical protein
MFRGFWHAIQSACLDAILSNIFCFKLLHALCKPVSPFCEPVLAHRQAHVRAQRVHHSAHLLLLPADE